MLKQLQYISVVVMIASVFFVKYLSDRVDTLKDNLDKAVETNQQLAKDIQGLQNIEQSRRQRSQELNASNAKMHKDAARSKVVAAKPKLVEKQINESFNKMTQDLSEATK
ncbi:putative membrane protein [Serratia phage 4S]|nr:putative membrane protein [Serratia phage 4S]